MATGCSGWGHDSAIVCQSLIDRIGRPTSISLYTIGPNLAYSAY